MIPLSPASIGDFSGGITDNFIDSPPNKYFKAENMLITENGKLTTIPGSEIYDVDKPQLPTGNQRINTAINFDDSLIFGSGKKLFYENGAFWTELVGPDASEAFNLGDANSYNTWGYWNKHLYLSNEAYSNILKLYLDDTSTYRLRSAGLPPIAAPILAGTAGSESYIYFFHYSYQYKVGTVTFIDRGPVVQAQILNVNAPDVNTIQITSIPVLANAAGSHYDTANIKVEIYRTISAGDVGYKVGEVTNGTTIFNDTFADSTIQANNITVYTTGGVLNNDPPPPSKAIHMANGFGWYGNVKIGNEIITNRLLQSVGDDLDSVPLTNFIDLEDEIIAVSSYLDRIIALCSNSVYLISGFYDEFGNGGLTKQRISDTFGCVSANSVVQIQQGVVFASKEGFCFTDGFNTYKITEGFNQRYRNIVQTAQQRKRIFGVYDKTDKRIWWTAQSSAGVNDDCDTTYIFDSRFGISADSAFTTAGGQQEWAPSALVFNDNGLVRADVRGYIFSHSLELTNHPKVDTLKTPNNWFQSAIKYDHITAANSFGAPEFRKFSPRVVLRAENVSNLSAQIVSMSDLGSRDRNLPIIRWDGNLVWGDPLFTWGTNSFVWGVPGFIEEMRRFNGDDLRFSYKQLQIKNAYINILESDSLTTGTVNAAAKSVTIDTYPTFTWPEGMGGYEIYFEDDNYTLGYEINIEDPETIEILDPTGSLTDGSKKWIIKGFPKGEILKLISLTMSVGPLGKTQTDFSPSSLGGNT